MQSNTDWFKKAKWGVFCHYLAAEATTAEQWNAQVDGFDVPGLAKQLNEAGAPYFFITLGQCSGHFLSPNATYDSLVKRRPSRLSRRDIVAELIEALAVYGIRLLVYSPSHAPSHDREAVEALRCTPTWDGSRWGLKPGEYLRQTDVDEKLSDFQRHWEAIIREWSCRWGQGVHGWWFDGCYYADKMYRDSDEPNFKSLAAAARGGNPNSIVAFNPGVLTPVIRYTEFEDYTAGEINSAFPVLPARWQTPIVDGKVDGAQYHILSFLGSDWCKAPLRFPDAFAVGYTQTTNGLGGVVTWDVPIEKSGRIPEAFLRQLKAISESVG